MEKQRVNPELLAPAGNLDTAIAGLENGADAVYCGLKKFNARERTDNFTPSEMGRLIRYAHGTGKQVYVTCNTLIKDAELPEVYRLLATLSDLRPDGVIIQDLGVYYLLKTYFPHLPIHASTQMAVHNSSGVKLLQSMECARLIVERQVTIEELQTIKANTTMELEVFIHGALCCSLSGVCLFSSWIGGWSGNRGKCKQPCRRRYFSREGNGFFFSTNDLYSLDYIDTLRSIGVTSLKIEGRLKRADYVVPVVKAYRMMLDAPDGEREQVLSEARRLLGKSGGRYWAYGFRTKQDFKEVIAHKRLGVSGSYVGTIDRLEPNGFSITPRIPLYRGDELRIQPDSGEEGPLCTVTRVKTEGKHGSNRGRDDKISANQRGFIYCSKELPEQGLVYKVGYSTRDYSSRIKDVEPFEKTIDLDITVHEQGITVTASCPAPTGAAPAATTSAAASLTWEKPMTLPEAKTKPLTEDEVCDEFAKVSSGTFEVGSCTTEIGGLYFCQRKTLRRLRQEYTQWLDQSKEELLSAPPGDDGAIIQMLEQGPAPIQHSAHLKGAELVERAEKTVALPWANKRSREEAIVALPLQQADSSTEEVILPSFCAEGSLKSLKQQVDALYREGVRRFRVTSLYGLHLLGRYRDITIVTGFPLPAANRCSFWVLQALGASKIQAWVELEKPSLQELIHRFSAGCELYTYGRPPLLQTRAVIPIHGQVKDRGGLAFTVRREGEVTAVYPEQVFSIDELEGVYSSYLDFTNAEPGEENVSHFNYYREWM